MVLTVTIPDSLQHAIDELVDNGPYEHQRELVVAAYFLDVQQRTDHLVQRSTEQDLSNDELAELQTYVRTKIRSALLKNPASLLTALRQSAD